MEDYFREKSVLVAGGAGFIGSHLVDRLMSFGSRVTVVDNLVTGNLDNIRGHVGKDNFRNIEMDVADATKARVEGQFSAVFHLASPASPVDFERIPEEIYQVNGFGTHYLATWATSIKARFLFASTSEAYGDPLVHPQVETYTGNVNPVGPRACYDESKRFGEMVTMNAVRKHDLDGRIVRIFNTYGPRMRVDDGRVMPEFISQALRGDALSIHGNGEQTRSYCYVDDLVEYILRAMAYEEARGEVINIGNTEELSVIELAEKIIGTVGSTSTLNYVAARPDDPHRRQPDLAKAKQLLGFEPGINLDNGLGKTIEWFLK